MPEDIQEIKERLAAVESLLQQLPEVQAAVFFQMLDEYQSARLSGKRACDIWEIPSPHQRGSQIDGSTEDIAAPALELQERRAPLTDASNGDPNDLVVKDDKVRDFEGNVGACPNRYVF